MPADSCALVIHAEGMVKMAAVEPSGTILPVDTDAARSLQRQNRRQLLLRARSAFQKSGLPERELRQARVWPFAASYRTL
jgi:hypothetical protein